jgi:hypothetical protein
MGCPRCGQAVDASSRPGRPRAFCSDRCAQAERDERKKLRGVSGKDHLAPRMSGAVESRFK